MEKQLLESLLEHDIEGVAKEMILPRRNFTGGRLTHDFNFSLDAIDRENLTIRTHKFMETMLHFNEFTDVVNRYIYELEKDNREFNFDYMIFDRLKEMRDVEEFISGYTYNDPDDCLLDRDIHFTTFNYDGDYYVLMNIHYGADARAGFSDVACFLLDDIDYFFMGMRIDVYHSESDEDISVWELEEVATYDKEKDEWIENETGQEYRIYSSAEGY